METSHGPQVSLGLALALFVVGATGGICFAWFVGIAETTEREGEAAVRALERHPSVDRLYRLLEYGYEPERVRAVQDEIDRLWEEETPSESR